MHFSAFILPLLLFSYWFLVGYATLHILQIISVGANNIRPMLLAPAVGLAVSIICIFTLSWYGLAVKIFAWPLGITLFLLSIIILLTHNKKTIVPWRYYLPFLGIILAALYITGRPLLDFGFAWLSYMNDDMFNYCLSAKHFLNHSYFDIPSIQSITDRRDYSIFYWFMHVPGKMRSGSELLLAWVSALTHLSPDRIFMPVILSLHFAAIHAIAGLNYSARNSWKLAFFSSALYAVSAMASLGIFYQLIAQTDGLVLLIAIIAFLYQKNIPAYKYALLRYGILCALLLSALAIFYPELFSLFILSACIYFGVLLIKKSCPTKQLLKLSGIICLGVIIVLHGYLLNFVHIMLDQVHHANQSVIAETSIFPYFLVPSGLANLWGLQALAAMPVEPWLSTSILLGALFLTITAIFSLYWLWRDTNPCAATFVTIGLLSGYFFIHNADFILFKLAMYIQPFLWSIFVLMILWIQSHIHHKRLALCFFLITLGVSATINLYTEKIYLDRSLGLKWSDIPHASETDIGTTLDQNRFHTNRILLSDTPTVVLAKLESLHNQNNMLLFPGRNFFENVVNFAPFKEKSNNLTVTDTISAKLKSAFNTTYQSASFLLSNNQSNIFVMPKILATSEQFLLQSSIEQSIFNRWKRLPPKHHHPITLISTKKIHNYLIFINSTMGQDYYLPDDYSKISFYLLEPDYFYSNKTFFAINRYFLFEILNPSKQPRMVLNITTTLNADHTNHLPPAITIGEKRIPFNIVGNGSARVFSPIISPQYIHNKPFVMLDTGKNGQYFKKNCTGAMGLYGKNFLIDIRKLIGFSRDISMISDEQYQHLTTPAIIQHFPQDLDNPNLEYSGFYEDGWMGQDGYVYLQPADQNSYFSIKGFVPNATELIIWVDDKPIIQQQLTQGNFDITIPNTFASTRCQIKLHFSTITHLSQDDERPASARIAVLGFK